MSGLAIVMAHPDDEVFVAGTVAAWTQEGGDAWLLALTRGEAGEDRAGARSGEALAVVREAELAASAAVLDAEATAMRFEDGALALDDASVDATRAWLDARKPDVVITLGTDGAYGHVDHLACTAIVARASSAPVLHAVFAPGVFRQVHRAMARHAPHLLGVSDPSLLGSERADYVVDVRAHRSAKLAAAGAHVSQLSHGDPHTFLGRHWIDKQVAQERYSVSWGNPPDLEFWQSRRCASST